jgi:hypothetical protein
MYYLTDFHHTFLTKLCQTFMLLNLNPIMSVIANVPAATAATVRSLKLSIIDFMVWLVDRSLQSCTKAVEFRCSDCRGVPVCNFSLLFQSSVNAFPQHVDAWYSASIPPENCHKSYCDARGRRSSRSGSTPVCTSIVCLISFRWRLSKVLIQDMMLLAI